MAAITMKQLLEAGVHFGHQTRRWNPKMRPFIYGERNGIHIIDLNQTLDQANRSYDYVRDLVKGGGSIMFVGTKKQVAGAIAEAADKAGMPYVNFRWLGGMLTNFATIQKRIFYMKELRRMEESGEMEGLIKKERLRLRREFDKLNRNLGGVSELTKLPDALFVIDVNVETTAVKEAVRLGLPVLGLVDSNCDPDGIDFVIPGNDDAVRSAQLIANMIAEACIEGKTLVGKDEMKEPSADAAKGETVAAAPESATGE